MASVFAILQEGETVETTITYQTDGMPSITGDIGIDSVTTTYKGSINGNTYNSFIYNHKESPTKVFVNIEAPRSIGNAALQIFIKNIGCTDIDGEFMIGLSDALMQHSTNSLTFTTHFTMQIASVTYECILKNCTIGGILYNDVRFYFNCLMKK